MNKNGFLGIRVSEEVQADLGKLAEQRGVSLAEMIRVHLQGLLESPGNHNPKRYEALLKSMKSMGLRYCGSCGASLLKQVELYASMDDSPPLRKKTLTEILRGSEAKGNASNGSPSGKPAPVTTASSGKPSQKPITVDILRGTGAKGNAPGGSPSGKPAPLTTASDDKPSRKPTLMEVLRGK